PIPGPTPANNSALSLHDALPICSRIVLIAGSTGAVVRRRNLAGRRAVGAGAGAGARISNACLPAQRVISVGRRGLRRYWRCRLRSEEHTSELQSRGHLVCRLLLE